MDTVKVQFLGTGDAFGSGGRLQTCFMVSGETRFLIDCGATALISMHKFAVDPNSIHTIFLTHLHGDHAGGIPFFILDAQLNRKRLSPLTIVGPKGTIDWYPKIMEALFPGSSTIQRKFPIAISEFAAEKAEVINGIEVESFAVAHGEALHSLALRIAFQDKIITYSGDTQWTNSLPAAAKQSDLFITEAYFYEKKIKNHLDYETLKAHWHEFDARRIILTHMSQDMLAKFSGTGTETANDGETIEI